MVRFLLNNTIVSNPINWDTLKSKIKRGDDIEAILVTIQGRYDFAEDGYQLVTDAINSTEICEEITVSIQQDCDGSYVEIFQGIIYTSDVIINERTCIANCEILDISFFSKIDNNKNIKTCIDSGRSKNDTVITIPNQYLVDITNLTNPLTYSKLNVPCSRVEEAFSYMIAFMTDGQVGFRSDLFTVGSDWEGLCITTGQRIRLGTYTQFTEFSFIELFNEINNRIPIILYVDDPFTNPVVRIESRDDANVDNEIIRLDSIYEIISSVDTDKLYSSIKMGCPTFEAFNLTLPDNITYFTHKTEEFSFIGKCNIDNKLDLSNDWSVSTSLITACYGGDQTFDKNIFILDTDYTDSTNGITKYDNYLNLATNPFWYNYRLTNENISGRYFNFLPTSFAAYFSPAGTGTFLAYNGALATIVGSGTNPSFNFTNVAYNIGSDFNGTDRFVSPELGVYNFKLFFDLNTLSTPKTIRATLDIYDDTNVNRGTRPIITSSGTNVTLTGSQQVTGTVQAILPPSWYCVVRVVWGGSGTTEVSTNSYWMCESNSVAGGIYNTALSSNYAILTYDFEYPLSYTQWQSILSNSKGYIVFAMDDAPLRKGWIKELTYDHIKGLAQFKLINSKTTQNAT